MEEPGDRRSCLVEGCTHGPICCKTAIASPLKLTPCPSQSWPTFSSQTYFKCDRKRLEIKITTTSDSIICAQSSKCGLRTRSRKTDNVGCPALARLNEPREGEKGFSLDCNLRISTASSSGLARACCTAWWSWVIDRQPTALRELNGSICSQDG